MRLTDEDKRKLDGSRGAAVRHAMEHLVKMGEAFDAEEFVDLHSVHVFSDYRTIGDGGLEFYEKLADMGAKITLPSSCEPISLDLENRNEFAWPAGYEEKQLRIINALRRIEVNLSYSCTFYLTQNVARRGDNLAWIEGNATGYANSVVGARGNREDSITAPLAGIAGRIPKYGLLDPANRRGQCLIDIAPEVFEGFGTAGYVSADFSALGMVIGDWAYDRIPVVTGMPRHVTNEQWKALVSNCSPALTTTLMLFVGASPEAPTVEAAFGGAVPKDVPRFRIDRSHIRRAYEVLSNTPKDEVDVVMSGCPLKTIYEIQEVTRLLDGKRVKAGVKFYIHTDHSTYSLAKEAGLIERIAAAGALLTRDTCEFCMPVETMYGPDTVIATDSMKMRRLVAGKGKPTWRFGSLVDCVNAAVTGKFRPTRFAERERVVEPATAD